MLLPWGHVLLIVFGWSSFFLYILMTFIVFKNSDKSGVLRSSYIYLFYIHSSIECMLFLVIEFLMRPRRWAWVPFFTEDMKLLAEANYAFILVSRISISCGQAICAFNRYSVVGFEPSSYNKMWSPSILSLVCFGCWWTGVIIAVPVAIYYKDEIYFKNLPGGTIQLFGGGYTEFESLFMAPFCLFIMLLIALFYLLASLKFRGTSTSVEKRLFFCGLLSAFPFILETTRSGLGIASYILEDSTLFVMGGDLWFYEAELSFCVQVWVHALLLRPIKEKLMFWRKKEERIFTVSYMSTSRSRK